MNICDVLHDLEPFAQFKKRERHLWRSVTLLKVTLLIGVFHIFKIVQMVADCAMHHTYWCYIDFLRWIYN